MSQMYKRQTKKTGWRFEETYCPIYGPLIVGHLQSSLTNELQKSISFIHGSSSSLRIECMVVRGPYNYSFTLKYMYGTSLRPIPGISATKTTEHGISKMIQSIHNPSICTNLLDTNDTMYKSVNKCKAHISPNLSLIAFQRWLKPESGYDKSIPIAKVTPA